MAFHFFVFAIKSTNLLINSYTLSIKKKNTVAKYKILLGTSQDADQF